jgi:hypothetical protein
MIHHVCEGCARHVALDREVRGPFYCRWCKVKAKREGPHDPRCLNPRCWNCHGPGIAAILDAPLSYLLR